jgi:hypothetical protein
MTMTDQKLHLHNEGVRKITLNDDALCLDMQHYDNARSVYVPYVIIYTNIRDLNIDHRPAATILQPTGVGDVVHYSESNNKAWLLVDWRDYANKASVTQLYEFIFDRVEAKGIDVAQ